MYRDLQLLKQEKRQVEQRLVRSEADRRQMEEDLLSKETEIELQSQRLKLHQQLVNLEGQEGEMKSKYENRTLTNPNEGDLDKSNTHDPVMVTTLQAELRKLHDLLDERTAEVEELRMARMKRNSSFIHDSHQGDMSLADELSALESKSNSIDQLAAEQQLEKESSRRREVEERLKDIVAAHEKERKEREQLEAKLNFLLKENQMTCKEKSHIKQRPKMLHQTASNVAQHNRQHGKLTAATIPTPASQFFPQSNITNEKLASDGQITKAKTQLIKVTTAHKHCRHEMGANFSSSNYSGGAVRAYHTLSSVEKRRLELLKQKRQQQNMHQRICDEHLTSPTIPTSRHHSKTTPSSSLEKYKHSQNHHTQQLPRTTSPHATWLDTPRHSDLLQVNHGTYSNTIHGPAFQRLF